MVQLIVECSGNDCAVEEWISKFGRLKYRLPMISALVVEVSEEAAAQLKELQGVSAVFENTRVTAQMRSARQATGINDSNTYGLTGYGVSIAILDTGVAPADDLIRPRNRLLAFTDFVNGRKDAYDDNGHGTHVAGIAAGNGLRSNGRHIGIAPECGIVAVKTLDKSGKGNAAEMLAGLQWVIDNHKRYNIRIVNLSVGSPEPSARDPMVRAVEAAWDAGICVVVAAGNNGPAPGSITSPGVSRKVITVGASDDSSIVEISGNAIQNYSGRGPTSECIMKPDVLAPGADIVSVLTHTPSPDKKPVDGHYLQMSGTSMATPMVSGAIALLLQKSPELTPDDVKFMLRVCATDLNYPHNHQGWGVIDIDRILREEAKYVRPLRDE